MQRRMSRGLAGLPVILIICILLASLAVGIGFESLGVMDSLRGKQKEIRSFEDLIETCKTVSYGRIGNEKRVKLKLGNSRITVRGKIVQLHRGDEVLRASKLSLPLFREADDKFHIMGGVFSIELAEDKGSGGRRVFLRLTEVVE